MISVLGLERVVLVGLGLGGRVALSVFVRHTEQVAGLGLAGTDPRPPELADAEQYSIQQSWIHREGEIHTLVERWVDQLVGTHTTRRPEVVKRARQRMEAASPDGWRGGLEALKQGPDFGPELGKIDLPVAVVHGRDDRIVPATVAETVATELPDAELSVIPDAGYLVAMEQPEPFNQAVDGLLARI